MKGDRLGIIVAGGPAPGINGVISAATIEAINNGLDVVGFYDGFLHLADEQFDPAVHTKPLDISAVRRIHFEGGSILRTSRASLIDKSTKQSERVRSNPERANRTWTRLKEMGITHMMTIGGDDTALSARFTIEAGDGSIGFVHIPKTIDNDLPLPGGVSTFGFSTARHVGSLIVKNLMTDSHTTSRWYIVVCMGRKAGFLAADIGKAAGVTLSLIPEEFPGETTICEIADVIEGSILKRRVMGRPHGVAMLAEGLAYRLGDSDEIASLLGREVPLDDAGHIRLSEVPLAWLVKQELQRRFQQRGDSITVVGHTLGYELRCAPPAPFDMCYTRDLGYGGVRLLLDPEVNCSRGVLVALQQGNLEAVGFDQLIDEATNRTQIRLVNLDSNSYRVARAYMIRIAQSDLDSPQMLEALAREARMEPEAFRERYAEVVRKIGVDPVRHKRRTPAR